jgi:hypothetical protein
MVAIFSPRGVRGVIHLYFLIEKKPGSSTMRDIVTEEAGVSRVTLHGDEA